MWTFDQDKYQKQFLASAVKEFTSGGLVPEPFERYALDPELSDATDIQQATKTVFSFWNKNIQHPTFQALLGVFRAEHEDTVRVLTDEKAREELRNIAKEEQRKKQEKRFEDLDSKIRLYSTKGYLIPEEKNALITKFTSAGLTESEILSRVKVPIEEERKVEPPEQGLDSATRKTIRSNLAVLGKRTLYEFLEIRPNISKAALESRYKELKPEWDKRKNDNKKISAKALLEIVKNKLLNDGLEKYERALVWDVIDDKLRTEVEFAAVDKRISREEFETLVNYGMKVGLTKEQTTEAILWLAHEKKAFVELSERTDTVFCAKCYTNSPKDQKKCTSCGEDLWTVCPKCTTKIAACDTACGNCGFVTADRHRINLLIRKVHLALGEKKLDDALKFARDAERIWGSAYGSDNIPNGDITVAVNKVEQLFEQAKSYRKDYEKALSQKKLRAARDSLGMLIRISPHYKEWDGKTPESLNRELELQFQKAEKLIEKGRKYESEKNLNEAIRVYQEILNIAVDFEEVQKTLKKYPPEPAGNVVTTVYEGGVVLKWNESPAIGNPEYVVVRCEGRPPVTHSDGEIVAKISNNSFCDESVRPGSFVYYGIFTERGGAYSSCVVSNGVLAIKEVEGFSLEAGDEVVRGSWKFSVPEGKVRVLCGGEASLRKGEGREIPLTNPHSFTDNNLTNGQTYAYRVFVEYRDPTNKTVATTGKFASATPAVLPDVIERLDIRSENGELRFQWAPPPFGTVSIYRLLKKPEWKCGSLISPASLAQIGTPLREAGGGLAVDIVPANGQVYYTPFTISGDIVRVGQTKEYVPAEEISGLSAEDFESYLLLRWKWSGKFQSVIVAWGHDSFPVDAHDKKAVRQKVTRGEYDLNGGFRLQNPKKKPYKFAVFTVTELEGKSFYSVGLNKDSQAEVRSREIVKVNYSLALKGWWRKTFVVSLSCEETISSLPAILVVGKPGETQPLDSESGKIIARIENASLEPPLPFEYEFEMPKLRRPFFVRLFFASPGSYKKYKLLDPPPKQLKVK